MATTEILMISDSHGRSDLISRVLRLTRPHLTIFCGDGLRDLDPAAAPCPLYAVRGNCDWHTLTPIGNAEESLTLYLDGLKTFVTHGHRYGVKSGLSALLAKGASEGYDVMLFGHTHEPLSLTLTPENAFDRFGIQLTKPLYLFNPGSLGSVPHSFGRLTIRDGVPLFSHGTLPS